MKKYLSGWEDEFTLKDIEAWCGDYTKPWKTHIRNYIQKKEYKTLLDIGAGPCSEYYGFKNDGYEIDYTATDITPKYIDYSLSRGIKIIHAEMDSLPFEDEEFDCSICLDVMTHQLEYKKAITEMLRVSKSAAIITFFKPFEEEAIFGQFIPGVGMIPPHAHTSGLYRIEKTSNGTIEHRIINKIGETICIYNFFTKATLVNFLDSLNINYTFEIQPENLGKTNLFLEKRAR